MLPKDMLVALCMVQKMLGTIQVCCCLVAIGPRNRVLFISLDNLLLLFH